jgi:rubrerythrin
MKLENFGSILSFAIEIEAADYSFYKTLADSDACGNIEGVFLELAGNAKKNEKKMLRARQENITEMILEPINDFNSDSFSVDRDIMELNEKEALKKAIEIETTAESYYSQASEKIKNLSEISRILKKTAQKRVKNIAKLTSLYS